MWPFLTVLNGAAAALNYWVYFQSESAINLVFAVIGTVFTIYCLLRV